MATLCSFLTGDWPNGNRALGDRYAQVVAGSVAKYAPGHEFVLFTDRKAITGVTCRPIPTLDGWFGSLYQFSPDAFPEGTRVFSVDLDTAIIGDISPLLSVDLKYLVGIDDTGPKAKWTPRLTNGVMSWIAGPRYWPIWEQFKPNIGKSRPLCLPGARQPSVITDEAWLRHFIGNEWVGWGEATPGAVISYKWHTISQRVPVDEKVKIVYFHGQPRPHQVPVAWNPHRL